MAGPATIRQGLAAAGPQAAQDITVEDADDAPDGPVADKDGTIIRIEHGDGSVTVALGGDLGSTKRPKEGGWFKNIVADVEGSELARICDDLLVGIADDMQSRREWQESYALGIKLLGFTIEVPNVSGASDGAPVEGMSRVRHPLLAEAVLRFQANARSELLPTDGPVKIRNDDNDPTIKEDQTANALEQDMNHYLTAVATEYYPDTDRMLLRLGFGGMQFKKVYFCPLRNRPVSETVDANDLIVNEAATDLSNAKRVTHRINMQPSTVKRLQILGVYRDVSLQTPASPTLDSVQREEKAQQGISPDSAKPEDRDREIYECYCELDIKEFEHQHKGSHSGLEIPYRVTIDVTSREILSIVRNYNEDTKDLPKARTAFVKYTFVPGFGFCDIGLLHILGNATNALTAAWRIMLDNGMFSNFPGFLIAKAGTRQNTNIFRVPPGGGAQVDTQGLPINQAIMPLPYNTQGMAALMGLTQEIETAGGRLGGTSELQVGEGQADAPVGTTLALIEQATKIMDSVHKRLHASQCEEFALLVDCFREHPESFWQRKCKSDMKWSEQTFIEAVNNCELVPQADPNTASHAQRVMKIVALMQLAAAQPTLFNPVAIANAAVRTIGFNPAEFMASPQAQAQIPPEMQEIQAKMKVDQQKADADTLKAQTDHTLATAKIQGMGAFKPKDATGGPQQPPQPSTVDQLKARASMLDAQTNAKDVSNKLRETEMSNQNQDADRRSREEIEAMKISAQVHEAHAARKTASAKLKQKACELA